MRCEQTLYNVQRTPPTTLRVVPPPRAGEGLECAAATRLRLSLPVSGRGDRPNAAGWGLRQRVKNGLQDALDVVVDIVVPESQNAEAGVVQPLVTRNIARPAVLASVHFNGKSRRQTREIENIAETRNLPPKVDTAFLSPGAEVNPQCDFLRRHSLTQTAGLPVRHRESPPTTLRVVPPPRPGEGLEYVALLARTELRLSLPGTGRGDRPQAGGWGHRRRIHAKRWVTLP